MTLFLDESPKNLLFSTPETKAFLVDYLESEKYRQVKVLFMSALMKQNAGTQTLAPKFATNRSEKTS